jgi:hypothetical protein
VLGPWHCPHTDPRTIYGHSSNLVCNLCLEYFAYSPRRNLSLYVCTLHLIVRKLSHPRVFSSLFLRNSCRFLRCPKPYLKPDREASKDLEWRALLRVKDDDIMTKPSMTRVVNGVTLELSAFYAAVSGHVSFHELSKTNTAVAPRTLKEAEWRQVAMSLADKLQEKGKACGGRPCIRMLYSSRCCCGPVGCWKLYLIEMMRRAYICLAVGRCRIIPNPTTGSVT